MRRLILIASIINVTGLAIADWDVREIKDTMTDELRKTAFVKNEEGNMFSIYRISKGGEVWGTFSLSESIFDQIDPQKPPMFRVDKNESVNLIKMKKLQDMGMGINAYEWNPKWVNFLIWHGKEKEGIAEDLILFMEGEKVVFRYYLATGGYKETAFTLKGASKAISKAIGISDKIDHSKQEEIKKNQQEQIKNIQKERAKKINNSVQNKSN